MPNEHSTHHVHRGAESLPCYCAATSDHTIGQEQTPSLSSHVMGKDGWPITSIDILREWFGGERYARDHEYLDANYGRQAQQVVDWLLSVAPAPQPRAEG